MSIASLSLGDIVRLLRLRTILREVAGLLALVAHLSAARRAGRARRVAGAIVGGEQRALVGHVQQLREAEGC